MLLADGHIDEAGIRLGSTVCWDHIDIPKKKGNGMVNLLTHLPKQAWRHFASNNSRESWEWVEFFLHQRRQQGAVLCVSFDA